MRLLKIGTLNLPRNRWEDALYVFDDIDVFCFENETELKNAHFHYIKFNESSFWNRLAYRATRFFSHRKCKILCNACLSILRVLNARLLRQIRSVRYDYIHSSYNDFDESAFLTALLSPTSYTRAQKETRLYYAYLEERAFKNADRIVLNHPYNRDFFTRKYGAALFEGKNVLFGLDEDVRTERLLNLIEYSDKLSDTDGKVHAVILAGRVLSNPNDMRSGGRLYYINMIRDLVQAGIVVHLHTANIIPFEGVNPYKNLEAEYKDFHIEDKIDFSNDPINAYRILSRYDIGVCHAHIAGCDVTEFDKYNIPHRYYEYHLAHVAPFDIKGGNLLLEEKSREGHALIFDSFSQISLSNIKNIIWDTPVFSSYIRALYPIKKAND